MLPTALEYSTIVFCIMSDTAFGMEFEGVPSVKKAIHGVRVL